MWVGHNEPWIWPAIWAASIPVALLNIPRLYYMVPGVVLCWWIATQGTRHLLLPHCPRCAAAIPVNPLTGAAKHARALRADHVRRRYGVGVLVVALGSLWLPWWQASAAASAVILVIASGGSYVMLRHKQFGPWCPICHPDGGGGWVAWMPDPTPPPAGTKPRQLVTR